MKKILLIFLFILPVWLKGQTGLYQPLGGGAFNGTISSLTVDSTDNMLYVAGSFNLLGGNVSGNMAKWDGNIWDSVHGLPNSIDHFAFLEGELFAYGSKSVWKKTSGTWSLIATTNNQSVTCLVKYNNKLLIMGGFDTLNGQNFNSFALYDGTNLLPFSNYITWAGRNFRTAVVYNNEVFVGGQIFDSTGTINGLMKWNGTQWVSIGTNIVGTFGGVSKLLVYDNKLFVGGSFDKASGNVGNALFSFDGTSFNDLGGGLHLAVYDMTVHDNELFIVGPCKTDTDREFKGFLSFNGNDFCFYDSVPCNTSPGQLFSRITFYNDSLIVGGANIAFNGDTMKYIAKFTGDYTTSIGCEQVIGIEEEINKNIESLNIYPNPASDQITIEFELTEANNTSIKLTNILGQTVWEMENVFIVGNNKLEIDVGELPKGLYFVQLVNSSTQVTQKFIIE
jgi:hypothetical protein